MFNVNLNQPALGFDAVGNHHSVSRVMSIFLSQHFAIWLSSRFLLIQRNSACWEVISSFFLVCICGDPGQQFHFGCFSRIFIFIVACWLPRVTFIVQYSAIKQAPQKRYAFCLGHTEISNGDWKNCGRNVVNKRSPFTVCQSVQACLYYIVTTVYFSLMADFQVYFFWTTSIWHFTSKSSQDFDRSNVGSTSSPLLRCALSSPVFLWRSSPTRLGICGHRRWCPPNSSRTWYQQRRTVLSLCTTTTLMNSCSSSRNDELLCFW